MVTSWHQNSPFSFANRSQTDVNFPLKRTQEIHLNTLKIMYVYEYEQWQIVMNFLSPFYVQLVNHCHTNDNKIFHSKNDKNFFLCFFFFENWTILIAIYDRKNYSTKNDMSHEFFLMAKKQWIYAPDQWWWWKKKCNLSKWEKKKTNAMKLLSEWNRSRQGQGQR